MSENEMQKKEGKLDVRRILKILSVIVTILFFFPSFVVSCSGQNMEISALTAVKGIEYYGETIVEPKYIILLGLLLPVVSFVSLFMKKLTGKMAGIVVFGCAAVDLIIWFIFRSNAKKIAEESMCKFKITGWYVVNVIVLLIILILSAMIIMKIIKMETDIIAIFSSRETRDAISKISDAVSQMSDTVTQMAGNVVSNVTNKTDPKDVMGYCSKCGKPIVYGCKFCTSCGTVVPSEIIAAAEAERKEAEKAEAERKANERTCSKCGEQLAEDAVFCTSCGEKNN